jgi:hypothetical protein
VVAAAFFTRSWQYTSYFAPLALPTGPAQEPLVLILVNDLDKRGYDIAVLHG